MLNHHLQLLNDISTLPQTVRALAGEGDEVGSKAIALLENWKQLVSVGISSNPSSLPGFLKILISVFPHIVAQNEDRKELPSPQVMTEGGAETLTPPEPEPWNEGSLMYFGLEKWGESFELLATSVN